MIIICLQKRYLGADGYIPGSTIGNIPTKDETEKEDTDKNNKNNIYII